MNSRDNKINECDNKVIDSQYTEANFCKYLTDITQKGPGIEHPLCKQVGDAASAYRAKHETMVRTANEEIDKQSSKIDETKVELNYEKKLKDLSIEAASRVKSLIGKYDSPYSDGITIYENILLREKADLGILKKELRKITGDSSGANDSSEDSDSSVGSNSSVGNSSGGKNGNPDNGSHNYQEGKAKGSLLDDFADPSTELPDYFAGDD